jgi:hypothetical protein
MATLIIKSNIGEFTMSSNKEIIARVKKLYSRDTLLGRQLLCVSRNTAEHKVKYIAVYDCPYLIIIDSTHDRVLMRHDVSSSFRDVNLYGANNQVVIEISKLSKGLHMVALTGRQYSLSRPIIATKNESVLNAQDKPEIMSRAACYHRTQEIDLITPFDGAVDRLYMIRRGLCCELLQFKIASEKSLLVIDKITSKENELERHLIRLSDNLEIFWGNTWNYGPWTELPVINVSDMGVIITPNIKKASVPLEGYYEEPELTLLGKDGKIKYRGESAVALSHYNGYRYRYPHLWISTATYSLRIQRKSIGEETDTN